MVNVWKVSTLVLAGALAVVVGRGAVRESSACDGVVEVPSTEQQTRLRLARGLAFLERAEDEIEAATAARPKERADALVQIAKARASVELALSPVVEPKPKPRPRPMKGSEVADPFATPPEPKPVIKADVVNPFLKAGAQGSTTNASVRVVDPWVRQKRP